MSKAALENAWGDRWRDAVERRFFAYSGKKFRSQDLKISGRTIESKLVDESWEQFRTVVMLSRFLDAEEENVQASLLKNPELARKLSHYQQPKETLEFVEHCGLNLLPERGVKFSVKCSCGAQGMCAHAYAALYAVGEKIDRDPFTIFRIRGLDLCMIAEQCGQADWEKESAPIYEEFSLERLEDRFEFGIEISDAARFEIPPFESANIPDVRKNLLSAFVPSSVFKESFVQNFCGALTEIFDSDFENYPDRSIDLTEHRTVRYVGNAGWIFGSIPLRWGLDAVSVAVPSEMESADASAKLLDYARKTAVEILQHGAFYPRLFAIDQKKAKIFWLPMLSVSEVRKSVERLQKILPQKFVRNDSALSKSVQNSAEMLVIGILSAYMQSGLNKKFQDELLHVFFGDVTLGYTSNKLAKEAAELNAWLSIFEISYAPYLPNLLAEDAGFGKIDLEVEFVDRESGELNSLSKIWTVRFPAEIRTKILASISPLREFIPGFDDYLSLKATDNIHLAESEMVRFVRQIVPLFRILGIGISLPQGIDRIVRGTVCPYVIRSEEKAKAGFCRLENLLRMDFRVLVEGREIEGEKFLAMYEKSSGLLYEQGQYFFVEKEDVERLREGLRNRFRIPALRVLQIALAGEFEGLSVGIAPEALAEIHRLKEECEAEIQAPKQIRAKLRPYQARGFAWMLGNAKLGFGCILADDMGLGKTLQVISLLQRLKNDGAFVQSKAIVVVPSGLLQNWKRELEKFAPELSASFYHGASRNLELDRFDVLVTTYGILRTEKKTLSEIRWQVAIIDEAQNIKNAGSSQSRAVKALNAPIRIAMSGTPVENRLMEFWSVMDFCNHGLLGNAKTFREEFEKPIQERSDRHRTELFKKVTAPFLLRRLKTDRSIITDLPEKLEQNDWAELSPEQAKLYNSVFESGMKRLADLGMENLQGQFERSAEILRLILALKQICNHPAQYLKDGNIEPELSGKMELFLEILDGILDSDEKVLVFTQFTEMGEILSDVIEKRFKLRPLFYHGGLSLKARDDIVSEFESQADKRILILSLKAGGTGLNLTAASQVIHYDLWWNPAVEAQATDRAYRIGQNRRVVVHRLITKDTFEEKIDALLSGKKKLSEMTVATDESWIAKLSDGELREVFTLGKS